jgi:hypothetical protein
MVQAAGICAVLLGVGFGIPGIIGARHLAGTGQVWYLLGFPTYRGPFERVGIETSPGLILAFVAVCAAEVMIGAMLIVGWTPALWWSLALLPFELTFWTGFALPYAFVVGALRVAFVWIALAR